MTEKELKGYVLKLFKYKSISSKQFMTAKNNLEQIKEFDELFYYFNMGKFQSTFGNIDYAISCLNKAIELNPENSSVYYHLYKCYVKKGSIDDACQSINQVIKYKKDDVDFSFATQIIKTIQALDTDYLTYLNSNFDVTKTSKLGYNDLSDNDKLLKVYKSVIQAFNDRDYVLCVEKLRIMDTIITETNYPMEVDTLISLIKLLKDKEIISCKNALSNRCMEKASIDNYCKFQMRLFELGNYTQERYLRFVEQMIEEDIIKAKKMLDIACENLKFSSYLDMIEYLEGCIKEKQAFMNLSKEKQEEFLERRLDAKNSYKYKYNEDALKKYCLLKEDFNLPICDYYIGKIYMFRMRKFMEAKLAFLSYLNQGGVKTEKTYMFLAKISKIQKNPDKAKQYLDKMDRIHKVFLREFDFLTDKDYERKKKIKFVDDSIDEIDVVKRNTTSNIKMTEEDFSIEEKSECLIDEKLNMIKELLQTGNDDLANKLFKEVQSECTNEEREKVKSFERNKKLYKNQKRSDESI